MAVSVGIVEIIGKGLIAVSVLWAVFLLFPGIDLGVAALFYHPESRFAFTGVPLGMFLMENRDIIYNTIFVAVAGIMTVSYWRRLERLAIDLRATVFVVASFLLGPGLLTNAILKEFWDRARPRQILEFGGDAQFGPPLVIQDQCATNCSFVSGEAAFAFAFLAFALLAHQRRPLWIGVALGFGLLVGLKRIVLGAHFFSDVIFAGVLNGIVILILYRLIVVRKQPDTA